MYDLGGLQQIVGRPDKNYRAHAIDERGNVAGLSCITVNSFDSCRAVMWRRMDDVPTVAANE